MADVKSPPRKSKLPPIDPNAEGDEADKPKKKITRKKKKPVDENEADEGTNKPKPNPRRKKAASADSKSEQSGEVTGEVTAPVKKKKKTVKKTDDPDADQTSARSAASQGEDVEGSKASLIKSPKDATPRKKKGKKKVKKDTEKTGVDNFLDSTLAADLSDLHDDIISHDTKRDDDVEEEEEEEFKQPHSTVFVHLRSQPTEKFYIETDGGFKGESKNRFAKRQAEEAKEKAIVKEEPTNTTMEFAIRTQTVIRTFSLFCHGMLAGLALWHIVMAYTLLDFELIDFMAHYRKLALPVQCTFFILLVICTVSALDRFDLAYPTRRFMLKALTLQNGTISVILYFAALVVSLSNGALEDKIHLYDQKPYLWNNTETANNDLMLWRDLNTSRNILSILGWFVISLTPLMDRLTDNLRQTDEEELLGVDVDAGKSLA